MSNSDKRVQTIYGSMLETVVEDVFRSHRSIEEVNTALADITQTNPDDAKTRLFASIFLVHNKKEKK